MDWPPENKVIWRVSANTSRTKQESDLSSLAGAPGVRVFATRGLRVRKALANPVGVKKISQIEAKEKSDDHFDFLSGGHGPDLPRAALEAMGFRVRRLPVGFCLRFFVFL